MEENVLVEDTSEELFLYLEKHVKDFSPSEKDTEYIKDTLKLNEKKQVQIDGAIALPLLGLAIGALINIYQAFTTPVLSFVFGIVIFGILLTTQIGLLFLVTKRKKIVKPLFIAYYVLYILLNGLGIPTTIAGIFWMVYMIRSRRVKYTFVE